MPSQLPILKTVKIVKRLGRKGCGGGECAIAAFRFGRERSEVNEQVRVMEERGKRFRRRESIRAKKLRNRVQGAIEIEREKEREVVSGCVRSKSDGD
ncbi:hypothetical protein RIF29_29821 [Crotalaria pallida]|uniref:Uncharacterized protein n=1 Tax=Crotalaria pallida TaxID=3830 RepID=A0AAN9EFN3_CROPI